MLLGTKAEGSRAWEVACSKSWRSDRLAAETAAGMYLCQIVHDYFPPVAWTQAFKWRCTVSWGEKLDIYCKRDYGM